MTIIYPRTGPDAYTLPAPACLTCTRRHAYGVTGPCDRCSDDPWFGAR